MHILSRSVPPADALCFSPPQELQAPPRAAGCTSLTGQPHPGTSCAFAVKLLRVSCVYACSHTIAPHSARTSCIVHAAWPVWMDCVHYLLLCLPPITALHLSPSFVRQRGRHSTQVSRVTQPFADIEMPMSSTSNAAMHPTGPFSKPAHFLHPYITPGPFHACPYCLPRQAAGTAPLVQNCLMLPPPGMQECNVAHVSARCIQANPASSPAGSVTLGAAAAFTDLQIRNFRTWPEHWTLLHCVQMCVEAPTHRWCNVDT
jgi:hypothetical protein